MELNNPHTSTQSTLSHPGTLVCGGLSFRYPGRKASTLQDISLQIGRGEVVLLTGATGSGKSTLLKCLAGLIPHFSDGVLTGQLLVDGLSVPEVSRQALAQHVGMVLQSPDAQLCASRVQDEIAFGLENLRIPPLEIDRRIRFMLEAVGLEHKRTAPVQTLSGGQKQRLVIAAALAMSPRILLLDEPISQLDPLGAQDILRLLERLKQHFGLTLVLAEHRVEEVSSLVQRVVVMDAGQIVLDSQAVDAWCQLDAFRDRGIDVPFLASAGEALQQVPRVLELGPFLEKVRVEKQLPALERFLEGAQALRTPSQPEKPVGVPPVVQLEQLFFRYQRNSADILHGLSLAFRRGERIALLGANGSGKSTLLSCLAGVQKPTKGALFLDQTRLKDAHPDIGLMFQDPDLMLLCETVDEELRFSPRHRGLSSPVQLERLQEAARLLDLLELLQQPPHGLSRGQRLRVALASVLTAQPRVLLLDEPTTGQDRRHIEQLMAALTGLPWLELLIFATHDLQTALAHATRIVVLHQGNVWRDFPPAELHLHAVALEKVGLPLPPRYRLARMLEEKPGFAQASEALPC